MFSARTSFFSTQIVTDGLVTMYDAGDINSYPGTGNNWFDLVGNATLTLTNGPVFSTAGGGSIDFDGTNDYAGRTGLINLGQNITISVWFNPDAVGTTRRPLVADGYSFTTADGVLTMLSGGGVNNGATITINNDNPARVAVANTVTVGSWQNLTFVRNGTAAANLFIYKNNANTASAAAVGNGNIDFNTTTSNNMRVAGRADAADYYDGKIAIVMMYNKALSTSELTQNYNALRSRFGV